MLALTSSSGRQRNTDGSGNAALMQAMRQRSSSLLVRLRRHPVSPTVAVEAATSNTGVAVVAIIEGVGTHEVLHMTAVVGEAAVALVATHQGVAATAHSQEVHRRGPIHHPRGLGTHRQSTTGLAMAALRHVISAAPVVVGAGMGQVPRADVQATEVAAEATAEAIMNSCRSGGSSTTVVWQQAVLGNGW